MKALVIITLISLLANVYLIYLKIKGKDKDNDFIDDDLEAKFEKALKKQPAKKSIARNVKYASGTSTPEFKQGTSGHSQPRIKKFEK